MSGLSASATRMEAVRESLAAFCPHRKVSRDFLDFAQRDEADLKKGLLSLIADGGSPQGEGLSETFVMDSQNMAILGQIKLPEGCAPSEVENAEMAMLDDVLNWMRSSPEVLDEVVLRRFRQSKQVESPYGWMVLEFSVPGDY